MKVVVERSPSEDRTETLGTDDWDIWEKRESSFDWSYDRTETFHVLEGEVTVLLPENHSVTVREGDLAQFPEGLSCRWNITSDLRKVFTFQEISLDGEVTEISEENLNHTLE